MGMNVLPDVQGASRNSITSASLCRGKCESKKLRKQFRGTGKVTAAWEG